MFVSQNHLTGNNQKEKDQPFEEVWRQVNQAVSNVVDHVTFADLHKKLADKIALEGMTFHI